MVSSSVATGRQRSESLPPVPPTSEGDLNALLPSRPLIKEYAPGRDGSATVILRNDHYGSSVATFAAMFNQARQDFPDLKPDEAELKHYGGSTYKGTYGLEFQRPTSAIPVDYAERKNVEFTLG